MSDVAEFSRWLGIVGAALSASVVVYSVLHAARSHGTVAWLWWSVVVFATGIMMYSIPSFLQSANGSLLSLRTVGIGLFVAGALALILVSRNHRRSSSSPSRL